MSPAVEYQKRLKEREASSARSKTLHLLLGIVRLLLAVITAVLAWESFRRHVVSPLWLALPITIFVLVAVYHSQILRAQELANRATSFYKRGLARIEDRWAGTGQTGERFNDHHHEYAADLDLFGRGGLFELLSTARTRSGEDILARWLLSPSSIEQIQHRHIAVQELRKDLDLGEALSVLRKDSDAGIHPDALMRWAEEPSQLKPRWMQWLVLLLAILAIAAVLIWAYRGIYIPMIVILLVEAGLTYVFRKRTRLVLSGSEQTVEDLTQLSAMLARIERQRFASSYLQSLQNELTSRSITSSQAMGRLRNTVNWAESRRNLVVSALDVPLMYSIQLAFMIERWRGLYGSAVRSWLQVVGEIEALISLATYSYEHPDDVFPEFESGSASLDAVEIGHPLLPQANCVRNTVRLSDAPRVLLISGSNMSGKSTLLRAVGINVVLAMAGAPVRARAFRLSPLQVGASIRINDSLQDGSSRFYAEITRLRRLFDLTSGGLPLLFLLDELLQGTNSRDRLIGAEGVISAFLERKAIGLFTTHDLALTEMNGQIGDRLRNSHFQEEFTGGRMHFDYQLREGVVTKSNGLELMRSIGLEV